MQFKPGKTPGVLWQRAWFHALCFAFEGPVAVQKFIFLTD